MATKFWRGIAQAIAQVDTIQITAFDAATTYSIEVNGVPVASVPGNTSANQTATDLAAEWEVQRAASNPYAVGLTATAATDTVTLTGPDGMPFTVTSSVSGGTGTIGAPAVATAASGPHHWSVADNWDGGVPVNGDDVIVKNSSVSILWDIDQNAVDLDSLSIEQSFTGTIGLPAHLITQSADGLTTQAGGTEYRDDYLIIGSDVIEFGFHAGGGNPAGSGRLKVDNDSATASDCIVYGTANTGLDAGMPAVRYLASHANADIDVRSAPGGFGVAIDQPDETSTIGVLAVAELETVSRVHTGAGVTVTTIKVDGGEATLSATGTVTTLTVNGGDVETLGDFVITTANGNGGNWLASHVPAAGDAVGTLNMEGASIDTTGAASARTFGVVNPNRGDLTLNDANLTITTLNEPSGLRRLSVALP